MVFWWGPFKLWLLFAIFSSFCINCSFYFILKVSREANVQSHPVIKRLVQYQAVCICTLISRCSCTVFYLVMFSYLHILYSIIVQHNGCFSVQFYCHNKQYILLYNVHTQVSIFGEYFVMSLSADEATRHIGRQWFWVTAEWFDVGNEETPWDARPMQCTIVFYEHHEFNCILPPETVNYFVMTMSWCIFTLGSRCTRQYRCSRKLLELAASFPTRSP